LEGKVAKGKAPQTSLTDAKTARDTAALDLEKIRCVMVKDSLRILTKCWCDFYTNSLQIMNTQLNVLGEPQLSSQPPQQTVVNQPPTDNTQNPVV